MVGGSDGEAAFHLTHISRHTVRCGVQRGRPSFFFKRVDTITILVSPRDVRFLYISGLV